MFFLLLVIVLIITIVCVFSWAFLKIDYLLHFTRIRRHVDAFEYICCFSDVWTRVREKTGKNTNKKLTTDFLHSFFESDFIKIKKKSISSACFFLSTFFSFNTITYQILSCFIYFHLWLTFCNKIHRLHEKKKKKKN